MIRSLAYVVPTYRTAETLSSVIDQIEATAPGIAECHEVVVVDDACPDRSGAAVAGRRGVRVFGFDMNHGQRTAVLVGMSLASAEVLCVLDADLQDDPADVAALVNELERSRADVICAGRRGPHQSLARRVQAWLFRRARWLAVRGAVPADAGLFHVARGSAVRTMLTGAGPGADPLVGYARTGARIGSVPIPRRPRPSGRSAYTVARRMSMALASVRKPRESTERASLPTPHEITGEKQSFDHEDEHRGSRPMSHPHHTNTEQT